MKEKGEVNSVRETAQREEMLRKIEADFGRIFDSNKDGEERVEMMLKKVETILSPDILDHNLVSGERIQEILARYL